jgi:hypothetical protein
MASQRSRRVGIKYEQDSVNKLKDTGYFANIGSSRLLSRWYDNNKIDICNANESVNGKLPYHIQCKCYKGNIDYMKVYEEIPKVEDCINMVWHKRTEKRGTRFFTVGNYVFLSEDDAIRMMVTIERYKEAYELLNEHFDSIDDEFKPEVHEKLEQLGL